MNGEQLVALLMARARAKNYAQLARWLEINPATITNIRGRGSISATTMGRYLDRLERFHAGRQLIEAVHPLVELFWIDEVSTKSGKRLVVDKEEHPELAEALKNASGIYAFYDSRGHIVYLGKTERQNLLAEMNSAFNRKFASYRMMAVRHPHGRWKPNVPGKIRQIREEQVSLFDTCQYFSAYRVKGDLIGILEALLIRVMPNDVINVKMEKGETEAALEKWQGE